MADSSEHPQSDSSVPGERIDDFFVVGIGASAGGIGALETFFDHVSDESGMAFVVVQHLDPSHESELPAILQRHTELPVEHVTDRTPVRAGHVYVIPPGKSLSIEDGELHLSEPELSRRERTPIDLFFRTLARSQGERAVGIVLSGSGSEGAAGLRAIHEAGGFTLVQDPTEAEYPSMPRHARATGVVDVVLPVAQLAERLRQLRHAVPQIQLPQRTEALSEEERDAFGKILEEVQRQTGNDFSNYKGPTVLRRINRRMQINNTDTLTKYLRRLRQTGEEAQALFKELLISVTQFFRDPEAFAVLEERVIPTLFNDRDPESPIRVWVPGCATGEEAYSIGMLLLEASRERGEPYELQIFATDVDERAIHHGRNGLYPSSIEGTVSPERLQRFFSEESEGYRVRRRLREQVIFAPHNLLKDPPFSNLDLLSCRNLLIYLNREMQDQIQNLFHYALRPGGVLFVGPSESVGQSTDLFSSIDASHGIYRRKDVPTRRRQMPMVSLGSPDRAEAPSPEPQEDPSRSYAALHRSLRETHAPPSLLVDDQYEILHVTEGAEQYLQYPAGVPTQNVLEVIRSELRVDLRTALFEVFRVEDEGDSVEVRRVQIELDGEETQLNFRVRRIEDPSDGMLAMITFEERDVETVAGTEADEEATKIRQLERELDQTKERLALTIEEYEAQTEDLQASNEELQSMNEELKSTAEELETSKEELQSVNEELYTVNQELQSKNEALAQANSDLRNLMASTGIGVIFLDQDLHLRRYTPPAQEIFNFIPADEGRPLSDLRGKINYGEDNSLVEDAARVLDSQTIEREIQKDDDQWYLVRLLPYRTREDQIDGVVITFIDITSRKKTEIELREHEEELRDLNETLEEKVEQRTQEIRELSSELTLAEQNERDRISQVLHDELQQELHAVQMWAKALESDKLPDDQKQLLEDMRETLSTSLERTQTLAAELSPPVMESTDFRDILQWLAIHVQDTYGLDVEMDVTGELQVRQKDMRTLLFRLLRELLFNVVKHAEADQVRLRGRRREDDRLVVEVIDDGKGFDPETLDPEKSEQRGFYTIRHRLDMVGGHLDLESAPGEGTRATIVIPLDSEAEAS